MNLTEAENKNDLADIELCRDIAKVLLTHYPGHLWHVGVDSNPNVRMVDIKLAYPDRLGVLPKFGYKMMIDNATSHRIMMAGGELLERYRLARARATPYAHIDVINNGLDRAGEVR